MQGCSGGSSGARKNPSSHGQAAAAAGAGRVWGGQGWQPPEDTVALKVPGGQATGYIQSDTSEVPNPAPHPQDQHLAGGREAPPKHPERSLGGFISFCSFFIIGDLSPKPPHSWLSPAALTA